MLDYFSQQLPESPKWVGLFDHDGSLVAQIGKIDFSYSTKKRNPDISQYTQQAIHTTYDLLENLSHGNVDVGIYIGGEGTLFILNMNDAFHLVVSYHGLGAGCCYTSLDATSKAIKENSIIISNALYLNEFPDRKEKTDKLTEIETNSKNPGSAVDAGLDNFRKSLTSEPQWAMIINNHGDLIGFSGTLNKSIHTEESTLTSTQFAKYLARYIANTYQSMSDLKIRGLTYLTIDAGTDKIFIKPLDSEHYLVFRFLEMNRPVEIIKENVRLYHSRLTSLLK